MAEPSKEEHIEFTPYETFVVRKPPSHPYRMSRNSISTLSFQYTSDTSYLDKTWTQAGTSDQKSFIEV